MTYTQICKYTGKVLEGYVSNCKKWLLQGQEVKMRGRKGRETLNFTCMNLFKIVDVFKDCFCNKKKYTYKNRENQLVTKHFWP